MPLLTGPALGAAIRVALSKKNVTQKAFAAAFHVTPQSVQDWLKRGVVGKDKLFPMLDYFRDAVEPEHWGLQAYPAELDATSLVPQEHRGDPLGEAALRVALQTMHVHAQRASGNTRAELRRLTDLYWTNPGRYGTLIDTMGDLLLGETTSTMPNLDVGQK